MEAKYIDQVSLLLRIVPETFRIEQFALHGGSAINLFFRNMPRLSVDIDLTYIPYGKRKRDLSEISRLLQKLSDRLKKTIPGIYIRFGALENEEIKLFCRREQAEVKIEVNTINRGVIGPVEKHALCSAAQERFNMFFEMNIVPKQQLFGGKIVAALDRQHPRDLFDTMKLLDQDGIDDQIMQGFLFCMFSSKRPFSEILLPNILPVESIIQNQFKGMTNESFTPDSYNTERERLINVVHNNLTVKQKAMIISIAKGEPEWLYDDWSNFPGIAWKLKNINILKNNDSKKFNIQLEKLQKILVEL